jgi:hypothetical protein
VSPTGGFSSLRNAFTRGSASAAHPRYDLTPVKGFTLSLRMPGCGVACTRGSAIAAHPRYDLTPVKGFALSLRIPGCGVPWSRGSAIAAHPRYDLTPIKGLPSVLRMLDGDVFGWYRIDVDVMGRIPCGCVAHRGLFYSRGDCYEGFR